MKASSSLRQAARILIGALLIPLFWTASPTLVGAAEVKTIAVIPKGTTHVFWQSVHAGAVKAEREIPGIKVIWQGPLREDDHNSQISIVQNHVAKGTDAIVLAPSDARAMRNAVHAANVRKIPVVIIDSDIERQGIKIVSYIATDNYKGGQMAAEKMNQLLGGKGNVIMMRYAVGSASTEAREKGFMDTIAKFPGIKVISSNQYAGATSETAMQTAGNIMSAQKDFQGFYAPNESSVFGMLRALQNHGLAGKVKVVGFDASAKMIEAMKAKEVDALVTQDPFKIGYEGVKAAVAALKGEKVPARLDTGCAVVTLENLNDPAIKAMIQPPLEQYLK